MSIEDGQPLTPNGGVKFTAVGAKYELRKAQAELDLVTRRVPCLEEAVWLLDPSLEICLPSYRARSTI